MREMQYNPLPAWEHTCKSVGNELVDNEGMKAYAVGNRWGNLVSLSVMDGEHVPFGCSSTYMLGEYGLILASFKSCANPGEDIWQHTR